MLVWVKTVAVGRLHSELSINSYFYFADALLSVLLCRDTKSYTFGFRDFSVVFLGDVRSKILQSKLIVPQLLILVYVHVCVCVRVCASACVCWCA